MNVEYLRRGQLRVHRLSRGFAWLDAGTSSSLHDASAYVQTIEKRAGIKIGCPEEAAFRAGFLKLAQLEKLVGRDAQLRIPRLSERSRRRGKRLKKFMIYDLRYDLRRITQPASDRPVNHQLYDLTSRRTG